MAHSRTDGPVPVSVVYPGVNNLIPDQSSPQFVFACRRCPWTIWLSEYRRREVKRRAESSRRSANYPFWVPEKIVQAAARNLRSRISARNRRQVECVAGW